MTNTSDFDDLHKRADSLFRKEKYADAIRLYTEILEHKPEWEEVWYKRGKANYELHNIPAAIQDMSAVLKLDPNHLPARVKRVEYSDALSHNDYALVLQQFPDYCSKFYQGDPSTYNLPTDVQGIASDVLHTYQQRAREAEHEGRIQEAIHYWQAFHDSGGKIDHTSEDVIAVIDKLHEQLAAQKKRRIDTG